MSFLLLLHVLVIGAWLGCIGAELILERSRINDHALEGTVIRYHYYIDLLIELPLIVATLVTGALLLQTSTLLESGLFQIKLLCALIIVFGNLVSVVSVVMRKRAYEQGDMQTVQKHHKLFDWIVLLGGPAMAGAFWIGIYFAYITFS